MSPLDFTFTAWLYRPYLDLGPMAADGDPFTTGVVLAFASVRDGRDEGRRLQGFYTATFREELILQSGAPAEYAVSTPGELPSELRTPEWQLVCDELEGFANLHRDQQVRLLWLLHRLVMPEAVARLAAEALQVPGDRGAEFKLMLGFAGASIAAGSTEVLARPLEQAWAMGRPGSWSRLEASYLCAQQRLKRDADAAGAAGWIARHREEITRADLDAHDLAKFMSRYHRMAAMIPQLQHDATAMTHEMNEAERHTEQMLDDTPEHRAERRCLMAALLQSRTKEHLVLENLDAAERFARANVEQAPTWPHAYMGLGQVLVERGAFDEAAHAYSKAARYGPPATEESLFMAAQCWERAGAPQGALNLYLDALRLDPWGVTTAESLAELAEELGDADLARWARARHEALSTQGSDPIELRPYQQYRGVLGQRGS